MAEIWFIWSIQNKNPASFTKMPSRKTPIFSVVIPAYNEEKYITACVKSVLNQDFDKNLYEFIVVNNASTDKTAQVAKSAGAKVVNEPKKSNTQARITGINKTKGEIIAFTDADSRVPSDWLTKMYANFKNDSKLDAIGGVFSFWDGNSLLKLICKMSQRGTYHVSGGNMAIRRKSYFRIGGFDPKITLGEDVYLHLKLKKHGKVIIDYTNIVEMSSRRFSNNFLKTIFIYFSNDLSLKLSGKPLFTKFTDIR